jgi:predicted enzyme related to lactoylglutathione lyase
MATKKAARRKVPTQKTKAKKVAPKKTAVKRSAPKQSASKLSASKPVLGPGVVHWEIQAKDAAKQQQFYAELFGWKVDANNPMGYGMVESAGEKSIGGGIGTTPDAARVTVYVGVPDINVALAKAAALGATTVLPRAEMEMVTMALFRDLEGNVIGLVEG